LSALIEQQATTLTYLDVLYVLSAAKLCKIVFKYTPDAGELAAQVHA